MRILITGITGLAGSHLADYLLSTNGCEVFGSCRWRSNKENISEIKKNINLYECELKDPHSVTRMIKEIKPERIYHFAAQSSVSSSWNSPQDTLINNVTSQLNLFEAVRLIGIEETRILISGSSEEYGLVYESELPVTENNQLRPMSPYGVSKVTQTAMAFQYYKNYGMHIVRTRSFNHTGPRRNEAFVTSNFAKQIVEIELGKKKPVIHVGNLSAIRDFSDIRDIVKAYYIAIEHGIPGEMYNIGSDFSTSIKDVLGMLLELSDVDIELEEDPSRIRPLDVPELRCDSSKFRNETGWKPDIIFKQTLSDLLDYWREKLSN